MLYAMYLYICSEMLGMYVGRSHETRLPGSGNGKLHPEENLLGIRIN